MHDVYGAILAASIARVVWGANASVGVVGFRSLAQNAQLQALFSSVTYSQITESDLLYQCEKLMEIWREKQSAYSCKF
jgi:hypothetical protein